MWTIFKVFIDLLQYCFCFMFWFFGREACGILAPWPGFEPTPPALEGEVLTTGLTGKSQLFDISIIEDSSLGSRIFKILLIVYLILFANIWIINNFLFCRIWRDVK